MIGGLAVKEISKQRFLRNKPIMERQGPWLVIRLCTAILGMLQAERDEFRPTYSSLPF